MSDSNRPTKRFMRGPSIKRSRPLLLIVGTLYGARAEAEEGPETTFPRAEFRALVDRSIPWIWERDAVQKKTRLWNTLRVMWHEVPEYLLIVPIRRAMPPTVAMLGMRQAPNLSQMQTLSKAVSGLVVQRNRKVAEAKDRFSEWHEHQAATIAIDLRTGCMFPNVSAKKLFQPHHPVDLEDLVGLENFHRVRDAAEQLKSGSSLDLEFGYTGANDTTFYLKGRLIQKNDAFILAMTPSRAPAPPQASEASSPGAQQNPALLDFDENDEEEGGQAQEGPAGHVGELLFWLRCNDLDPIPLGYSYSFTIGRHENNDLVLPDSEVSRFHAVFKVRGRRVLIEDLGSSNGISINGLDTPQHELSANDKITIGPYSMAVMGPDDLTLSGHESLFDFDDEPLPAPAEPTSGTEETFAPPSDTPPPRPLQLEGFELPINNAALSGSLEFTPLSDLLLDLEQRQKSGTLDLLGDGIRGRVVLAGGLITEARAAEAQHIDALARMLLCQRGRFTFCLGDGPLPTRARTMLTPSTVLEELGLRRLSDEAGPHNYALPQ
jgi:hypothetical protein